MHPPRLIQKFRFVFLFAVMLVFFIANALSDQVHVYDYTSFFLLALMCYSLYVISHKRDIILVVAVIAVVGDIVFMIGNDFYNIAGFDVAKALFALVFFGVMTFSCFMSVLQDKSITATTLFGSLCTYFFIGLSWTYLYAFIQTVDNSAFDGLQKELGVINELIYYSFVTLTTLGFGDVTPVSSIAKTVSWLEAYFGQAYLTLLMAQLVGRYIVNKEAG